MKRMARDNTGSCEMGIFSHASAASVIQGCHLYGNLKKQNETYLSVFKTSISWCFRRKAKSSQELCPELEQKFHQILSSSLPTWSGCFVTCLLQSTGNQLEGHSRSAVPQLLLRQLSHLHQLQLTGRSSQQGTLMCCTRCHANISITTICQQRPGMTKTLKRKTSNISKNNKIVDGRRLPSLKSKI